MKTTHILAALAGFAIGAVATAAEAPRPDIVVFLTDDQSLADTSVYGKLGMETPHLEQFAAKGMTFSHAYVASPSCAPSRAALLTGLMPARNGAEANHAKPREDVKKWPAYFQELGYQVYAYGKVSHYRHTGLYGFDGYAHDTFHDHAWVEAAADFLDNRTELRKSGKSTTASQPLCLMVGSNWPHVPWPNDPEGIDADALVLPDTSVDTSRTLTARAKLAAAVKNADDDFGRVMSAVDRNLSSTNTIVLFSTDHGTQWPFGKWNLYDEGIRVPLVVSWPGKIQAQSKSDALVSWVDFLPTLLQAVGGEVPKDLDGRSFLSVLTGEKPDHRDHIFTTHSGDGDWNVYPMRSVTDGRFKYIRNLHPEFAFTTHIDIPGELGRTNYWDSWERVALQAGNNYPSRVQTGPPPQASHDSPKFAAFQVNRYHARPAEELYDLATDPHEQSNLADDPDHKDQLEKMRNQVSQWMQAQRDEETIYGTPRLLKDITSYGPNAKPMGKGK